MKKPTALTQEQLERRLIKKIRANKSLDKKDEQRATAPRQRKCSELASADAVVVRLIEDITFARKIERHAWEKLAEHLTK